MKKLLTTAVAAALTAALTAGPNADRPDATHAWAVHDDNRPNAPIVMAPEGKPPADAVVLFDGTPESVARYWRDGKGNPTKWECRDGLFYSTPKSGLAWATEMYSDCQIHVELRIPEDPGKGLGNTGVYVGGWYELQVLYSSKAMTEMRYPHAPWKNANYADGQMGAVYGQKPPIVNPFREAGEWQSFDIIFHAARWNGDTLVEPATITAFLNGVLIQDNYELEGPTLYCYRTKHDKAREPTLCHAVALQDHGVPVPYRLVWVRPIPPRHENTTHGGRDFNPADAAKLRAELAAKTLALAHSTEHPEAALVWLWESYCYEKSDAVRAEIDATTEKYIARISGWAGEIPQEQRTELSNMSGFVDMGVRNGLFTKDAPLYKAVKKALEETKSTVRHF